MRVQRFGSYMVFIAIAALLFFVVADLPGVALTRFSLTHLVLAMGAFPLILGAIIHFTPALTRTGLAPWPVHGAPLLAMVAGAVAVWAMNEDYLLIRIAAPLGLVAGGGLFYWLVQRANRALAGYHPGLLWYQAALLSLLLALLAILVGSWFPEYWARLRSFHLHLNLMGFVGMAAIGTLQVLIPTAGGYMDPDAGRRLRVDLKYAFLGSLCSALGAAWLRTFSWFGLIFWMIPLVRLTRSIIGHRREILAKGGAVLSLCSAVFGFYLLMFAGLLIGFRLMGPENTIPVFFAGFIFPLVTGALTWLLPIWLRPGAQGARQEVIRTILSRGSVVRPVVFAGCAVGIAGNQVVLFHGAVALVVLFLGQVLYALWVDYSNNE